MPIQPEEETPRIPRRIADHRPIAVAVGAFSSAAHVGAGTGVQEIRRQWRRQDLLVGAGIHNGKPGPTGLRGGAP